MTLIVGIKCTDGIIVGSDGAATLGALGNRTVEQPTKKLKIHNDKIIVGVSGPVGLGQRLHGEIEKLYSGNGLRGQVPFQAMTTISSKFREHILPELEVATRARSSLGNVALESALSATVVAMPIQHEISLFQFDQQGSPEEVSEELPYVAIGSGQAIADPFLALIRRVFWSNGCPTINGALFAVVWTLQHAIETNPGGVAEPIQIMGIIKNGSDWEAKEYSDEELEEHKEAIHAAEEALKNFKDYIHSEKEVKKIPEPPTPKF